MRELLARCGLAAKDVLGIGIGVPGPVNFEIGQLVNPPLMPAWDSFSIRDYLREDYAAPVFVDNDVNLMALGELWRLKRSCNNFLVIKIGTGIGCGIVCHGEVYRGANGLGRRRGPHLRRPGRPALPLRQPRLRRGDGGRPGDHAHGRAGAEAGESAALAECLRVHGCASTPIDVGQASRGGDTAANASSSAPAA
jgi:predicted NBD/HSP70 family sugar kinase